MSRACVLSVNLQITDKAKIRPTSESQFFISSYTRNHYQNGQPTWEPILQCLLRIKVLKTIHIFEMACPSWAVFYSCKPNKTKNKSSQRSCNIIADLFLFADLQYDLYWGMPFMASLFDGWLDKNCAATDKVNLEFRFDNEILTSCHDESHRFGHAAWWISCKTLPR